MTANIQENYFKVYRFQNPDGSSKDWAIRNNKNGTYTKRWGKTGSRLQSKDFSLTGPDTFWGEEKAKENKGYQFVGIFLIDDDGKLTPASDKPENPPPPKESERIYWRLSIQPSVDNDASKAVFCAVAAKFTDVLRKQYPACELLQSYSKHWQSPELLSPRAGGVLSIGPLLLFMALKKAAITGFGLSLAYDDSVEISHQIKLETKALALFDTELEAVRAIAETLDLIERQIKLADIETDIADMYF